MTTDSATVAVPVGPPISLPPRRSLRTIVGTGIGNAIEWYDWNVYIVFAPFFAQQFFNPADPLSAMLSTLAIFAVGFVLRPLGGLLFGWIADRHGRRPSMLLAISLASAGSLLIGVSPTYAGVGVVASLLLLLARLLQGLAHGGEIASSYTYIAEMAPPRRRGLWSSTIFVSGMSAILVATVLGAGLTTMLTEAQMTEWGWRIPFVIGGVLGIVAIFLRRGLDETHAFAKTRNSEPRPARPSILRGMWTYRAALARVFGLSLGGTVFFYTWAVAAPAYAISVGGMDATAALWAGVAATALGIALLPLAGHLSDRFGRRPSFVVFGLGAAAVTFPLDRLIQDESWQLLVAMSIAMALIAVSAAIAPAALAELFPTHVRASGFAVPYSLAVALTGGTAPYLQAWLSSRGLGDVFLGYSVALLVLVAVVAGFMPETKGKNLD
ncbi:MFS transporter [Actinophytocola sp.]|uniref:MFS transporter n=1 Tax=Actinophytocola sp. TaxID=1872138 RepID=UPI002ED03A66